MDEVEYDPRISRKVRAAVSKWTSPVADSAKAAAEFEDYHRYIYRKWVFIFLCVALVIVVMGVAVTVGPYNIEFLEAYRLIWDHLVSIFTGEEITSLEDHIVVDLRMPRVIVGIIAGVALAVSGCVMQSTLLNPLADPYTTGVSSGASFGATLAMTMGITVASGSYAIVANAFLFSLIPTAMILRCPS